MVLSYLSSYVYGAPSTSASTSASTSVRLTGRARRGGGKGPATSNTSSWRRSTNECDGCYEDDNDAEAPGYRATDPALALLEYINTTPSLYDVVGVSISFTSTDELRRAYMGRCRVCHPDKFPNYTEEATSAFQRVSLAYETLSKPSSRRAYDISYAKHGGFAGRDSDPLSGSDLGDETLRSVLYTMYCDFMEKGDFEMVRVLVEALNASNPGLNLGAEAIDGIEGALKRLRHIVLSGAKHFKVVKFELIRLYEIQHDLRQLSYFDVFGRLRLSLQLARVTLSIPMAIDKSMREDGEDDDEGYDGDTAAGFVEEGDGNAHCAQVAKRGLLGPRIASVLGLAVAVLEKGERII